MEISRRNFMKASGGVVTLGIMGITPFTEWIRPASVEGGEQERVAYTFHPPNCGGRCSFNALFVKGN